MKCRLCRVWDALPPSDPDNFTGLCLCATCQNPVYKANIEPLHKAGLGDLADETCNKLYGWPKSVIA